MGSPSSTALPEEMEAKSSQRSQPPQRPQGENGEIITDIWWPKPSGVFCMLRWSHHLYRLFFVVHASLGQFIRCFPAWPRCQSRFHAACSVLSDGYQTPVFLITTFAASYQRADTDTVVVVKKRKKKKIIKTMRSDVYFPYQSSMRAPCQYSIKPKPYIKQAIKKAQSPLRPLAWLTDNPARRYQPNWVPLDPRLLLSASLQIMSYSAPIVGKAERSQREGIYK